MRTEAIAVDVEDGVAVVEWYEQRPEDGMAGAQVRDLLEREGIEAYVAVDRTEGYLGKETQEELERLATLAAENGIERVGLVGEAIKALAAKRAFDEHGLAVYTSEDREDAVEWARND